MLIIEADDPETFVLMNAQPPITRNKIHAMPTPAVIRMIRRPGADACFK